MKAEAFSLAKVFLCVPFFFRVDQMAEVFLITLPRSDNPFALAFVRSPFTLLTGSLRLVPLRMRLRPFNLPPLFFYPLVRLNTCPE